MEEKNAERADHWLHKSKGASHGSLSWEALMGDS